ncbi:hypothetical protein DIPPA_35420 [Diplonema papillatum]|nr:hypothetical protein DIPPA_35420 [Diplonema papillatum]
MNRFVMPSSLRRAVGASVRWASVSGLGGIEKITFVKKIKADGTPCKKCGEVVERLEKADQMKMIDEVLVADERDDASSGMVLAAKHDVSRAPFFVVENTGGKVTTHMAQNK